MKTLDFSLEINLESKSQFAIGTSRVNMSILIKAFVHEFWDVKNMNAYL